MSKSDSPESRPAIALVGFDDQNCTSIRIQQKSCGASAPQLLSACLLPAGSGTSRDRESYQTEYQREQFLQSLHHHSPFFLNLGLKGHPLCLATD